MICAHALSLFDILTKCDNQLVSMCSDAELESTTTVWIGRCENPCISTRIDTNWLPHLDCRCKRSKEFNSIGLFLMIFVGVACTRLRRAARLQFGWMWKCRCDFGSIRTDKLSHLQKTYFELFNWKIVCLACVFFFLNFREHHQQQ